MRGEALRWFSEALWDLDTAKILHREKRYNAAVFYSHQAAEKAVKALLYSVNEAPWGHSIRELLQRYFMRVGSQVDERLLTLARELDRHYITSRYPNALPSGTPHEVYDEEVSKSY
jgi:HEPN domain-containing protein